jgi:hypothetical protein
VNCTEQNAKRQDARQRRPVSTGQEIVEILGDRLVDPSLDVDQRLHHPHQLCSGVPMPMMQVRVVRMAVAKRRMAMPMRVRLACGIAGGVIVLMVGVVNVAVIVDQFHVLVLMLMPFREMEIEAGRHQHTRGRQL